MCICAYPALIFNYVATGSATGSEAPEVHQAGERDAQTLAQAGGGCQEDTDRQGQQDLAHHHAVHEEHGKLELMQRTLKREHSTYFSRRHDTHPFETTQELEKYCRGADCSLFLFGSNSKKRPHNIVLGRLYEHQVLDMVEFGLTADEEEVCDISSEVPSNCRPFVIFQGDKWETDETYGKLRNLLQDFFVENVKVDELEVNNAIRLVISFSAVGDRIYLRTYEVSITGDNILEQDGDINIGEVTPKVDMVLRRSKFADHDTWKEALKQPKPINKRDVQF